MTKSKRGTPSFYLLLLQILVQLTSVSLQIGSYDEGCSSDLPVRCQDPKKCFEKKEDCGISPICSKPDKRYQCPENECQDRFANCKVKAIECLGKDQVRCPDGFCRKFNCDKVKYSSCPMDKPLICGSRRCVSYPFQCTGGNHCPFDKPFLCPNMDCQNALIKCTKSYIGGVFQPK